MKPNEHDIFDELVRGKLTGYTEPIEPEWINRIHAKKSRVINLYQLYKIMLLVVLVGTGLMASIQLVPTEGTETQSTLQPSTKSITHPAVNTATTSFNPAEFASVNIIDETPQNYTTNPAVKNTVVGVSNNNTSATSSYFNQKNTATKKLKNSTTTQSHTPSEVKPNKQQQHTNPLKNIEPTISTDSAQNTESKQTDEEACIAAFDYYTSYTGEFNFTQQLAPNTTIAWNFGDGTTSEQTQPKHAYKQSGEYEVSLTVSTPKYNCSASKVIVYQNPNDKTTPILVSGKLVAGAQGVKNGTVELYQFDEEKGKFKSAQTTRTNQSGDYTISLNRNTKYLLKGYPTTDTKGYLATYWGNTTDAENAIELLVLPSENDDIMGYTIELTPGENQPSAAEIPAAAPIAHNQQVFLLDNNNNIVSIGTVDANGKYTFANPPKTGDYTIVNPTTGATAATSIKESGIHSGVMGNSTQVSEGVSVFPNPAHTTVNFGVTSFVEEQAVLVIMNAGGVELMRKQIVFTVGFNQSQYDVSNFSPGVYYVMIFRGNQQVLSNRIVKLVDSDK